MNFNKFILLLFVCFNYNAQNKLNYKFDHLNQASGFSAEKASNFQKDKFGNVWMLTEKGLMKYNGHSGKFYPSKKDSSGLLKFPFHKLYMDKDGILWISYIETCLTSFNPKTEKFTHYFHNDSDKTSFPNGAANKFLEDSKGNFWIAVWGGGLTRFDKKTRKFKTYEPDKKNPKAINTNEITSITELKNGKYLVGTWEGGEYGAKAFLQYFDLEKEEFINFPIDNYKFESELDKKRLAYALKIVHFSFEERDNIWVGTYSGLICINKTNKTITRYSGYIERDKEGWGNYENVISYVINGNELWLGTEVSGIMVLDLITKTCSYLNHDFNNVSSISGDAIRSLYKDEEENIWISNNGGVDVFSPIRQQFKLFSIERLKAEKSNRAQGYTTINEIVMSRFSDNIYLSHGNGFTILNKKTDSITHVNTTAIFQKYKDNFNYDFTGKSNDVKYIIELSKDELLVSSGISQFVYNLKTKIANYSPFHFRGIAQGRGKNGVFYAVKPSYYRNNDTVEEKWILEKFNNYTPIDSLVIPNKISIRNKYWFSSIIYYLDNDNWFIHRNRNWFYIFNDKSKTFKSFSALKEVQNMPDSCLFPLLVDRAKNIWYKSELSNKIYKFNYKTEKTTNYTSIFDVKENERVQSITEDKDSILWVAIGQNLLKYNQKTGEKFKYNKNLGLNIGNFSPIFNYASTDENIYLAVAYGLISFNPNKLGFSKKAPQIRISRVIINRDTLSEIDTEAFLSEANLSSSKKVLTFEFATDQCYTPGAKKYTYRLLGLDTTWENNDNRNFVTFSNLPPNSYTLEIKSKNVFGIESKTYQVKFLIAPPFWKTWWFIALEIILVGGIIYLYIKFRENKFKKDKDKLEQVVTERTKEIVEKAKEIEFQKEIIEEKNKEVLDSIKYAKRIQTTLLAQDSLLQNNLADYFVFFKPKDIVSGDFYWATCLQTFSNGNKVEYDLFFLAICDCTGHGVPGAFMSLLNISFLNEAISEKKLTEPHLILNYVREKLITNLSFDGTQDGMDGTLMVYNKQKNTVSYSSANNKPILIKNGIITELNADKMPIGKGIKTDSFISHQIQLEKNDTLYFYTDGYADQFGGPKGKKFKYKQLNDLLFNISHLATKEQKEKLETDFENWKGGLDQLDDVCVIGIRF